MKMQKYSHSLPMVLTAEQKKKTTNDNRKQINIRSYATSYSGLGAYGDFHFDTLHGKMYGDAINDYKLTLKAPITTAADDSHKYFFIVVQRK